MKYCEYCKVEIKTKTNQCPLCKNLFKESNCEEENVQTYPAFEPQKIDKRILTRIFAFLFISLTTISVVLNIMAFEGFLWCVIVGVTSLYIWMLVDFTILSKVNLGLKLFVQAVSIGFVVVIFEMFITYDVYRTPSWSIAYVMPFVLASFTFAIVISSAVTKMKWRDYVVYQLSTAMLGFVPLILVLVGLASPMWPSLSVAFFSFITLLSMFIFTDKRTKNELIKRFHL